MQHAPVMAIAHLGRLVLLTPNTSFIGRPVSGSFMARGCPTNPARIPVNRKGCRREKSLRCLIDVLDLSESARACGSVYLRGWDDCEHHTERGHVVHAGASADLLADPHGLDAYPGIAVALPA